MQLLEGGGGESGFGPWVTGSAVPCRYSGQFPRFFGSAKFYDVDAGVDTSDPWARNVALYAGIGVFFFLLAFVVCLSCAVCKLCFRACACCIRLCSCCIRKKDASPPVPSPRRQLFCAVIIVVCWLAVLAFVPFGIMKDVDLTDQVTSKAPGVFDAFHADVVKKLQNVSCHRALVAFRLTPPAVDGNDQDP